MNQPLPSRGMASVTENGATDPKDSREAYGLPDPQEDRATAPGDAGCDLAALVEDFLAQRRAGHTVSIDAYCLRHPDPEGELRSLLLAADWMERCRHATGADCHDTDRGPPSQLGEFRILREVGHGAMGVVYEAIQWPLGRRVALKILAPRSKPGPVLMERFRREAQVASRLHHTHIVPVHGAGEAGGQLFYAMQFIEGDCLLDWLRAHPLVLQGDTEPARAASTHSGIETQGARAGGATVREAVEAENVVTGTTADRAVPREVARIGREIAEAIEHAHGQRILHRDIKPSNILIDRSGRAWITDFGLAKPIEEPDLTRSGDLVGTLRYMAPERFRGQCDARSDLYSLGATLYEALLGRPLIGGTDSPDILAELSKGRQIEIPASESRVPADLRNIVNKAIRLAPGDRYASAAELADDLGRFLENRPIAARPPSSLRRITMWAWRNPGLARLSASLAAVVLVAIGALAALWQRSESLRAQAEANLHQAQINLQLAIDSVDLYCNKVSEDLRLLQQDLRPLRHQLLQTAVEFHRKLLNQRGHSRGSRIDLARAYARLGRLSAEIDSREETARYLQQATATFAELLQEDPDAPGLRMEYAQCLGGQGFLLETMGKPKEAEKSYLRSLELLDGISLTAPEDQLKRANLLGQLSRFYRRHRRIKEAEAPQLSSLAICEELHAAHPGNDMFLAEYVNALTQLGELYQILDIRRWREAEAVYHRALDAQAPLRNAPQAQPSWQSSRARIHFNLGRIERLSGRKEAAERSFRESADIVRRLATDHPSVMEHHALLATTLSALGELLVESKGYDHAAESWQEARTIWQRLTAMDPTNHEYQVSLGEAEMNVGEMAVAAGDGTAAMAAFNEAVRIFDSALRDSPELSRARSELVAAMERRARLLESQGQFEAASHDWERATQLAEPLMKPWMQAQGAICAARGGDHAQAAELAEGLTTSLATGGHGHGDSILDAARALALACDAAHEDPDLPEGTRQALADQYAARAGAILDRLFEGRVEDRVAILATADFASLRENEPVEK